MTPLHDRDGWIWMDGEWLPWREAQVHALTHTLHYGMGCFEGVRAYAGPTAPTCSGWPSTPAACWTAPTPWTSPWPSMPRP